MLPLRLRGLAASVSFGFLAALAAAADSGLPRPAPELLANRWSARWITHPAAPKSDYGVWLFRRTLELPAKPERFVVHVTADARYRLWVNGEPVLRGPQASDPQEWRYESADLAPWLRAGTNVIAAQVTGYGDLAPYASMGQRTAFLLQGDTAAERVADTGPAWKVRRDDAYAPFAADRARLNTFIVVGPGDQVDAAKHPWGWQEPGFDEAGWAAPRLLGPGQPQGWGTDGDYWLKPRSIPLLEEVPERLARVVPATGVTMATSSPARRLSRLDLPTLG